MHFAGSGHECTKYVTEEWKWDRGTMHRERQRVLAQANSRRQAMAMPMGCHSEAEGLHRRARCAIRTREGGTTHVEFELRN